MKKILVTFLILGLIGVIGLIFIKNNYVKAYDINLKDNLSLCSNCLIVTLVWFTYTNCSGANDGVGYCKEIIKIVFPRQWVNANVEYSVTWTGNIENWQNAPIGWIYFFDWDIPYTSGILDLDHVGICSQWINNNRYMIHAWNTVVEELATAHGGKIYAAYLTSIGQ